MKKLTESVASALAKLIDGVSSVTDGRVVASAQEIVALKKISEMFSQALASGSATLGNVTKMSKADALTVATAIFTGVSMAPWDAGSLKIALTGVLSSLVYATDTVTHKDKVEKFANFQADIIKNLAAMSEIIDGLKIYETSWSTPETIDGSAIANRGGL